jgi:dimethylargininase
MVSKAIVRPPSENFADGLTSVDLGVPIFETALEQHRAYCEALVQSGLELIELEADARYPDSAFVEDTAILTDRCAIITQPGAPSRSGEIVEMAETLANYYDKLDRITSSGTIDGGDVCQIEDHFLIGISGRTNEEGASQLSAFLEAAGYSSSFVDIRGTDGLLHLKSGISYLGEDRVLVTEALADAEHLERFEIVDVPNDEEYAANCIRVNDYLICAAGFPKLRNTLEGLCSKIIELEMSEFQKMDGGLSCLSLRF